MLPFAGYEVLPVAVVWQTRLANLFLSKNGDYNKKLKHVVYGFNGFSSVQIM